MSETGENEQALRKILDLTRLASVAVLLLHFYYTCYLLFQQWGFTHTITDRLLAGVVRTGLLQPEWFTKAIAIGLLVISLIGSKGKKQEGLHARRLVVGMVLGCLMVWASKYLTPNSIGLEYMAFWYMGITSCGYLLVLSYGSRLSRTIRRSIKSDIFNTWNESFPQEERLLQNEYSINLKATYQCRGKPRDSWVNIINPFRGTLVLGSPGSGKTHFVIQQIIRQHIEKGFSMFVYDFKFDDLTQLTYECLSRNQHRYPVPPAFYVINFDDLSRTHRCNPLNPETMHDITDAAESARAILLGLNREWINKQGDFFVESPINFLTAVIWFLRRHEDGKYCTLPHVIELMQLPYEQLFPILNGEPEIEVLINPFISAYQNDAMEQLEGQVASAKIGMARLASPQLYWVLCGNDFTLDINNPKEPKVVCMGNNPEKQQVYGAVLSLYVSRLVRLVNKKGRNKCSLVFDEFPTLFFNHIDSLIATARSNKVATTLCMQDFSQLKKDYGRDQAEVIMNITGNIISGQVMGDTAKQLSERFGKIMQERETLSINRTDTSISRSRQLEFAIPLAKISALSSGSFVGMVADNPDCSIELKMFHNKLSSLPATADRHKNLWQDRQFGNAGATSILETFHRIRMEVKELSRQ